MWPKMHPSIKDCCYFKCSSLFLHFLLIRLIKKGKASVQGKYQNQCSLQYSENVHVFLVL